MRKPRGSADPRGFFVRARSPASPPALQGSGGAGCSTGGGWLWLPPPPGLPRPPNPGSKGRGQILVRQEKPGHLGERAIVVPGILPLAQRCEIALPLWKIRSIATMSAYGVSFSCGLSAKLADFGECDIGKLIVNNNCRCLASL